MYGNFLVCVRYMHTHTSNVQYVYLTLSGNACQRKTQYLNEPFHKSRRKLSVMKNDLDPKMDKICPNINNCVASRWLMKCAVCIYDYVLRDLIALLSGAYIIKLLEL
jgi:hypothetical protein